MLLLFVSVSTDLVNLLLFTALTSIASILVLVDFLTIVQLEIVIGFGLTSKIHLNQTGSNSTEATT